MSNEPAKPTMTNEEASRAFGGQGSMSSGSITGNGSAVDYDEMTKQYARHDAITDVNVTDRRDSSGNGYKSYANYSVDPRTGQRTLMYTDNDLYVDGRSVADYKQGNYSGIILNNSKIDVKKIFGQESMTYTEKDVSRLNQISGQGCLLTAIADIAQTYGLEMTPKNIVLIANALDAFQSGTSSLKTDILIENGLNGTYGGVSGKNDDVLRAKIDSRLQEGLPTIAGFKSNNGNTHFVAISGYRENASGEITQYKINDPGTYNSNWDDNDISYQPTSFFRVNRSDLLYQKNTSYKISSLVLYDK